MFFGSSKDTINSIFCDCYSEFFPKDEILKISSFKWPDDFETAESTGISKFQVVQDFKSGLCLFNHEGNLYPFTERKILSSQFKAKKNVVMDLFGDMIPFRAENVYLLETGFNYGNIEYIIFDFNKEKCLNSFSSFRKVLYRFPLFWLMGKVLTLKEQSSKNRFLSDSLERNQKLENENIFSHEQLQGWQFKFRDTIPCEDEYSERVELPFYHYYFSSNDQVHIWLRFEFF